MVVCELQLAMKACEVVDQAWVVVVCELQYGENRKFERESSGPKRSENTEFERERDE